MRKSWVVALAGLTLGGLAAPAQADDTLPCPANLVCASKPSSVTDVIKSLEPTAKVTTDDDGAPQIRVTSKSYDYFITFKDCEKGLRCAALTFSADFTADKAMTLAFANKWNQSHRVGKAYLEDDGALYLQMEVSTVGGISKDNLRDWKTWWDDALSNFSDFFDDESAATAPAKKKS